MFRIDGISGVAGNTTAKDMTSVFLLVSVDKNAACADSFCSDILR